MYVVCIACSIVGIGLREVLRAIELLNALFLMSGATKVRERKKVLLSGKGGNQHYQCMGAIYLFFERSGIHVRVQCVLDSWTKQKKEGPRQA